MTSIMMRILSLLPMITAGLCGILLLISIIGIQVPEQEQKVPLIPCGIPGFEITEIHKYLKKVDGWEVLEDKIDGFHLIKSFKFDNFLQSQEFVNKVGEVAELEGHHPDLWFGWGYARIKIFTHAIKGLAESDFILAAKIDQISNV